jgi:hypothetical protein
VCTEAIKLPTPDADAEITIDAQSVNGASWYYRTSDGAYLLRVDIPKGTTFYVSTTFDLVGCHFSPSVDNVKGVVVPLARGMHKLVAPFDIGVIAGQAAAPIDPVDLVVFLEQRWTACL